ncbi:MAG: radical SAM protein [Oscillospiraceae bacterium]|nr:radical SAM protein [Oscillospiraceae bacterium]
METVAAKTILHKNKSTGWFGTDYNMNIYRGCCHGCIYCDSRSDCYQIDDFDTVKCKADMLQTLRDELRRKVRTGVIGTGAMSDPYNPFEEKALLTRHSLELIDAYGFGCAILSKSSLMTRDKDIFLQIKEHSPMICKLTITTADDGLCRKIEPNVSVSSERFQALAELSDSGLFTGIAMMPILPFIEDTEENLQSIVRLGHDAGIKFIYPSIGMTQRSGQREYYLNKLEELFPQQGLREKYISQYGNSYECTCPDIKRLWSIFTSECDKYGILYKMQDIISASRLGYDNRQLSFFD